MVKKLVVEYYVDHIHASHIEQEVLDQSINYLNVIFRTKTKEVSVTTGKVHGYLCIILNYSTE